MRPPVRILPATLDREIPKCFGAVKKENRNIALCCDRRAWGIPKGNGVSIGRSSIPLWPVLWVLSYRHKKVPPPAGAGTHETEENYHTDTSFLWEQGTPKEKGTAKGPFLFLMLPVHE